jgi:hypothetical protein
MLVLAAPVLFSVLMRLASIDVLYAQPTILELGPVPQPSSQTTANPVPKSTDQPTANPVPLSNSQPTANPAPKPITEPTANQVPRPTDEPTVTKTSQPSNIPKVDQVPQPTDSTSDLLSSQGAKQLIIVGNGRCTLKIFEVRLLAHLPLITILDGSPSSLFPLRQCQGDCDDDSEVSVSFSNPVWPFIWWHFDYIYVVLSASSHDFMLLVPRIPPVLSEIWQWSSSRMPRHRTTRQWLLLCSSSPTHSSSYGKSHTQANCCN